MKETLQLDIAVPKEKAVAHELPGHRMRQEAKSTRGICAGLRHQPPSVQPEPHIAMSEMEAS